MVNHEAETIYVRKSFMKNASKYGTHEYDELVAIKRDFPAYKVKIINPQKAANKVSMKGLSYQYMGNHIRTHYGENSANYTEYQNLMGMKEETRNHYMSMRKWFVETYPNWKDDLKQHEEASVEENNGSTTSEAA